MIAEEVTWFLLSSYKIFYSYYRINTLKPLNIGKCCITLQRKYYFFPLTKYCMWQIRPNTLQIRSRAHIDIANILGGGFPSKNCQDFVTCLSRWSGERVGWRPRLLGRVPWKSIAWVGNCQLTRSFGIWQCLNLNVYNCNP